MARVKPIYFDGSSLGNPGPIKTAVWLDGKAHLSDFGVHGLGSGNLAEFLAVEIAVDMAIKCKFGSVVFIGDSLNTVTALSRGYAASGSIFHSNVVRILFELRGSVRYRFEHVPRLQNPAGLALDQHLKVFQRPLRSPKPIR